MKNILAIAVLAAIITACTTQAQNQAKTSEPKEVAAQEARAVEYQNTVFATGPLAAAEEAKLSFKTGGIIAQVLVREGQKVRKGQLLAKLTLDEIQAATKFDRWFLERFDEIISVEAHLVANGLQSI